jgi:predicted metal-dependent hydrolase
MTEAEKAEFKKLGWTWADKLRVRPKQVRVQPMTRKWGSCSIRGYVSFAKELLKMESEFREYVVVHELLHLRIPNHGRLFSATLRAHCPQQRILEEKLNEKGLNAASFFPKQRNLQTLRKLQQK